MAFSGKSGKVVWNAEDGVSDVDIQHVLTWSVDLTGDVAEETAMADTWKSYRAGFKDYTATVDCNVPSGITDVSYTANDGNEGEQGLGATSDDTDPAFLKVFLELWFGSVEGDGILYGPAIATGISHVSEANDIIKVTYSFQGNGEMILCTTEPTDFVEPIVCPV